MGDKPEELILSERVPMHYFNGFTIAFGSADFTLTLRLDNRDFMHCKASFTTMKTLSEKLAESFGRFEKIVAQPMLTSERVGELLKASMEPKKE